MRNIKVLLVDDDESFLTIVTKTIESWGYDTIPVSSGREAINVVKKGDAGIIILDYKMPDMDGLATLKEIRKINSEIPVIMFSAIAGETIEGESELDVCFFIPKHSTVTNVVESLRTAIRIAENKLDK